MEQETMQTQELKNEGAVRRLQRMTAASAEVLEDLVTEMKGCPPEEVSGLLLQMGRISGLTRDMLAALRGASPLNRRRRGGVIDAEFEDTESGEGPGLFAPPMMRAETYGAHMLNELLGVSRAYLSAQRAPKLDDLMQSLRTLELMRDPDPELATMTKGLIRNILAEAGAPVEVTGEDEGEVPDPSETTAAEAGSEVAQPLNVDEVAHGDQ